MTDLHAGGQASATAAALTESVIREMTRLALQHNAINLAQGFTFTVAGYGAWLAAQNISTNGVVVVAAGVMTGALAGALTCLLAFIPLYDKPNFPLRSLIATLAISLMGGQGLLWLLTPRVKALPKIFGVGSIHIGPATASYDKIGAIVCSAILLLLTLGWMKSSRRGL